MPGAERTHRPAGPGACHAGATTTSVQGTRFEVAVQAKFLQGGGVFDAQQILTVPQVKLVKKLGDLPADQLALVEEAVRRWLGL